MIFMILNIIIEQGKFTISVNIVLAKKCVHKQYQIFRPKRLTFGACIITSVFYTGACGGIRYKCLNKAFHE